jgi:hypothetical protein
MLRFTITVVVGTLFYSAATVVNQILAPGDDNLAAFFAPIAGVIFSATAVTLLLLPLRAVLRRFLPGASQRSHALVTASVLIALVTGFTFASPQSTFLTGRLSFWAIWAVYALSITISLFWPLAANGKTEKD